MRISGCRIVTALLLALLSANACAAPEKRLLIRGGYIMPMTPDGKDLPQGDILIRDNTIVAIGEHLSAPGAEIIEAKGGPALWMRILISGSSRSADSSAIVRANSFR